MGDDVNDATPTQGASSGAVVEELFAELDAAGFDGAEEVGRGGFGVVFRATQRDLDRVVAVKLLTANLNDNRPRFMREQQAMGRLTGQPNIVAVLQVGETTGGYPYLVMPFHGQGSLQEQISRRGVLAVDEALRVGVKMSSALDAAHRLGILHRDVKPANILLNDYEDWALADFGIAHIPGGFATVTGIFSGSPAFSAPEVVAGEPPSTASDVYGLGATLFAALTGHAAFERHRGEQVVAQFVRITSAPLPDFRQYGIAADVAEVVGAAMARDPRDRPSTGEMGRQFQNLLARRHATDDLGTSRPAASAGITATDPTASTSRAVAPVSLVSFVGRTAELAEVSRVLSSSRLVTVTGVGGVGKTSLATQAAVAGRHDFADGMWLIELGDLREAALVVEFIAGALGVRDMPGTQLTDALIDVLRERKTLLVLDNCEHVTDSVATTVEALIRECPDLKILATSRERLDVEGERVLPLSPMSHPDGDDPSAQVEALAHFDSVALFVQQARAADPEFRLTPQNASAVARVCARLEGLPLAIELAAARLRVLSVEQIADALSDRYAVLTRGRRGAPSRQRTLASCIEWSYQLCTPAEQQLWERLSVFAGTFDMRAAHEICAGELSASKVMDLVSSLVDKSILLRLDYRRHVRFRMLETLRDYGHSRVQETDYYPVLSRRHMDWYRQLLAVADAEWFSSRQNEWIHRIIDEMPNVRKALGHSIENCPARALEMVTLVQPIWVFHGMLTEGRRWVTRALEAGKDEDSSLRAGALFTEGVVTVAQGDIATAAARLAEIKELLSHHDDPLTRGKMHFLEGFAGMVLGDVNNGIQSLENAIKATDDVKIQHHSKIIMGWLWAEAGDFDQAMTWWQDALEQAQLAGDSICRAQGMSSAGVGHWLLGDLQRGKRLIQESLQVSLPINDMFTGAQSLELLSWVVAAEGDATQAAVLRAAAAAVSRAGGAPSLVYAAVGPFHDECHQRLSSILAPSELAAADVRGDALSFAEAVNIALSGLGPGDRLDSAPGAAGSRR
jgi:non-specific serine/threonine protein kinase